MCKGWTWLVFVIVGCSGWGSPARAQQSTGPIGLGHTLSAVDIAAWDVAIGPTGRELPPGHGTAAKGADLFLEKCAACHGKGGREGPDDILVGGHNSLATDAPLQTVGSFWPYATTLYDYVSRAMPLYDPGSLTPDEVYAVTAFVLYLNGIVAEDTVLDARSLPQIQMPNRNGFRVSPGA